MTKTDSSNERIIITTQAEYDALPESFAEYTRIEIRSAMVIKVNRTPIDSAVHARDNSTVYAYDNSIIYARGNSAVYAYDNSIIYALDKSMVRALDNSTVIDHRVPKPSHLTLTTSAISLRIV